MTNAYERPDKFMTWRVTFEGDFVIVMRSRPVTLPAR